MPRTRRRLPIVLILLLAAGAAALTFSSCKGGASGTSQLGSPQPGSTHSGHGTDDPRVVLDALGDHVDVGVCARKNPVSADRSWSAPLVELPAALLDGNAGCGQQVAVSNSGGTTVTATVVGSCGSCKGADIALSPELFRRLASFGQFDGAIDLTWQYVS